MRERALCARAEVGMALKVASLEAAVMASLAPAASTSASLSRQSIVSGLWLAWSLFFLGFDALLWFIDCGLGTSG